MFLYLGSWASHFTDYYLLENGNEQGKLKFRENKRHTVTQGVVFKMWAQGLVQFLNQ